MNQPSKNKLMDPLPLLLVSGNQGDDKFVGFVHVSHPSPQTGTAIPPHLRHGGIFPLQPTWNSLERDLHS